MPPPEGDVGDAGGDGEGDLPVGDQFRARDGVRVGVGGDEQLGEQHAGAGARFAAGDAAPTRSAGLVTW
jgi:hypothetical protein